MKASEFIIESAFDPKPLLKDIVAYPNITFDTTQAIRIPAGTPVKVAQGGDNWRQNIMKFEATIDGKTDIWFTWNDSYLKALHKPRKRVKEDEVETDMNDSTRRQARLKAEIEAGMQPTVHNMTSSTDSIYTMGDLEHLGWMDKEYTHDLDGEVDGWDRYYSGPKPIKVHTQGAKELLILHPNTLLD